MKINIIININNNIIIIIIIIILLLGKIVATKKLK